jgi:hypothetical protein
LNEAQLRSLHPQPLIAISLLSMVKALPSLGQVEHLPLWHLWTTAQVRTTEMSRYSDAEPDERQYECPYASEAGCIRDPGGGKCHSLEVSGRTVLRVISSIVLEFRAQSAREQQYRLLASIAKDTCEYLNMLPVSLMEKMTSREITEQTYNDWQDHLMSKLTAAAETNGLPFKIVELSKRDALYELNAGEAWDVARTDVDFGKSKDSKESFRSGKTYLRLDRTI